MKSIHIVAIAVAAFISIFPAIAGTGDGEDVTTVEQMEAALGLTANKMSSADSGNVRFRAPNFEISDNSGGSSGPQAASAPATKGPGFFSMPVEFDLNSSSLTAESQGRVDQVAELLRRNPQLKLAIRGHTDATGTATLNRSLSKRRAEAVRQSLVGEGIAPARLRAEGLGESRLLDPIDPGSARNRRVEFARLGA